MLACGWHRGREASLQTQEIPLGVVNGTSKNVSVGKFWEDLEISEVFLISLEVSFLHGLFLLFLSLKNFYIDTKESRARISN